MAKETIPVETVKLLIVETVQAVSAATDKRQDAHEARTAGQMQEMSQSIREMSQTLGTSIKEVMAGLTVTNKQLQQNNAQFMRYEDRHQVQQDKHDELKDAHKELEDKVGDISDEQIKDTIARRVAWKVAAVAITGVLGGAFTFAWWMIKTITAAMMQASGAPIP